MKSFKICQSTLLISSFFGVSSFAAAPTSGAFISDTTQTYVRDASSDGLKLPNTVLCYMGGTGVNSSSLVNQGNYIALVDKNKCENSAVADSGSDNIGSSSAPNYITAIPNAVRTDNSSALTGKVWFQDKSLGPSQQAGIIYGKLSATKSVTEKPPYGTFHTDYCGLNGGSGNCTTQAPFYGYAEADGASIAAFQRGSGPYNRYISVKLEGDTSVGSGRVKLTQYIQDGTTISAEDSGDWKFSYNTNYFHRADNNGNNEQCFDRSSTNADKTSWSYGVYDSTGARVQRTSGFPFKTSNDVYGYVGYWGLWTPSGVNLSDGDTVSRVNYQNNQAVMDNYTLVKKEGRLKKLSLKTSTLGVIKNIPFTVFVSQNFTDSGNQARTAGTNLELKWDGTNLIITGVNQSNGISPDSRGYSVPIAAIQSMWGWNINGYSQSVGGSITVVTRNGGSFVAPSDTSIVAYRTETVIAPGSTDWPTNNLICVADCPKSGTALSNGMNNTNSNTAAFMDISGVNTRWNGSPVSIAAALNYTTASDGLLHDNSGSVAWSSSSAPTNPSFVNGFQSGRMVDSSDTSSVNTMRCDANGSANASGSYYCPSLLGRVATVYVWETGPNSWNKYAGLKSNNTFINFDPPLALTYTVPSTVSTNFAGANVTLRYNEFGDLQGIPGQCVNSVTNEKVVCGTNTRWVSAFSIPAGGEVTDGNTTYYVKPLVTEVRLKKVANNLCTTLTLPTVADSALPGSAAWVDPTSIGAMPSVTGAPRVIQGIVKY